MTEKQTPLSLKEKKALSTILAYKKTFADGYGKEVLLDLIKSVGFFGSSFVPGDPGQTAFNEGAKSLVIRILDTIETDPVALQKLHAEVQEPEVFADE